MPLHARLHPARRAGNTFLSYLPPPSIILIVSDCLPHTPSLRKDNYRGSITRLCSFIEAINGFDAMTANVDPPPKSTLPYPPIHKDKKFVVLSDWLVRLFASWPFPRPRRPEASIIIFASSRRTLR